MKYGLLKSSALNLGDEIQSVVVRPFLPRVDVYLDGCYLKSVTSDQKIKLIIHGCFNSKAENWPPSSDIEPLIVSFHMGEHVRERWTSEESIRYFRQHEPIGCRDYSTRDLLRQRGVEAYFSGCVTFMLKNKTTQRVDEVLLSDLDEEAMQYIPHSLLTKSTILRHGGGIPWESIASRLHRHSSTLYKAIKATKVHIALSSLQQGLVRLRENETRREQRFAMAEDLLAKYARAKLVITSRLHAALPCLAFGTPVIFVHRNLGCPRFSGLLDYLRAYSVEEFKRKVKEIDWEDPEPNPRSIDKLRDSLTQTCKEFINEQK